MNRQLNQPKHVLCVLLCSMIPLTIHSCSKSDHSSAESQPPTSTPHEPTKSPTDSDPVPATAPVSPGPSSPTPAASATDVKDAGVQTLDSADENHQTMIFAIRPRDLSETNFVAELSCHGKILMRFEFNDPSGSDVQQRDMKTNDLKSCEALDLVESWPPANQRKFQITDWRESWQPMMRKSPEKSVGSLVLLLERYL